VKLYLAAVTLEGFVPLAEAVALALDDLATFVVLEGSCPLEPISLEWTGLNED
jgi:hypothetical protein